MVIYPQSLQIQYLYSYSIYGINGTSRNSFKVSCMTFLAASVILFVCVCPHDNTKTVETTITKLGTGIVHHEFSPIS